MAASVRPLSRPVTAPAPRPGNDGQPRTVNAGQLHLAALASAPFWARQYTRLFLADCPGITADTAQTAQLIVSELVTNAAIASGADLTGRQPSYSQRAGAGIIRLSLRRFRNGLLIEVTDASPGSPLFVRAGREACEGRDAEHGRGLMLVDALCDDWGYYPAPRRGKVVYAFLSLADEPPRGVREVRGQRTP
jgi:anti-sigma regulatory factor (Ser/Thr protein kinase)